MLMLMLICFDYDTPLMPCRQFLPLSRHAFHSCHCHLLSSPMPPMSHTDYAWLFRATLLPLLPRHKMMMLL